MKRSNSRTGVFSRRLLVLSAFVFYSCAPDHGGPREFAKQFRLHMPQGAEQIMVQGTWSDDPRFRFRLSQTEFDQLTKAAQAAGYSEWSVIPPGKHFDYGSYSLVAGEGLEQMLICELRPNGAGGSAYMLFYCPSSHLLDAVSFKNH